MRIAEIVDVIRLVSLSIGSMAAGDVRAQYAYMWAWTPKRLIRIYLFNFSSMFAEIVIFYVRVWTISNCVSISIRYI